MKTTLLLATARRLAARSAARAALQTRAAPAALAAWRLSARPLAAAAPTTIATRAFSKKPRPTGDESDSSDDERESSDDEFSDDEEEEDDEDEDEEEEEEDDETYEAAKRAAFTEEDLEKFEDPAEYWDEERWGKLDSEDWAGFTGDLDAVTEEGVPVWLQSVRDLSAEQQEKRMRAKLARRALEEAKMNIKRYRKVDALGRAYGTGRRKTSTARVWIKKTATPFDGNIKVNKKDLADYFVRDTHREEVLKPFVVVNEIGNFDVYATVAGGGLTGQAGALRHGIARALQHFDPEMRPALKKEKLLKRDPRAVERKKAGQKKARKKFQWVKR